jgi:hypothetical protein
MKPAHPGCSNGPRGQSGNEYNVVAPSRPGREEGIHFRGYPCSTLLVLKDLYRMSTSVFRGCDTNFCFRSHQSKTSDFLPCLQVFYSPEQMVLRRPSNCQGSLDGGAKACLKLARLRMRHSTQYSASDFESVQKSLFSSYINLTTLSSRILFVYRRSNSLNFPVMLSTNTGPKSL